MANALEFRRSGTPPRVRISSTEQGSESVIRFADNGIGVESQYFERIFMIFQRLHSLSEYPGTGIRLSSCKKVIERNGGRIWVEHTEGGGATFAFSLRTARGVVP